MISKKFILIFVYITIISSFLIISMASNNSLTETTGVCNNCHGPSAAGHTDYTVTLLNAPSVESGTPTTLSATIQNNGYQFSTASLTLESSPDFSFAAGSSPATINLGSVSRGSSQTVSWNVVFKVKTANTYHFQVDFSGFVIATSHMQNTLTSTVPSSIYVSTTPIPILQVLSTPLPESTLYVGSTNNTGTLVVKNAGQVPMTNVTVKATGPVLVNNETSFDIPSISPGESKTYPITINTASTGTGTITVSFNDPPFPLQGSTINIYLRPNPADSFELFLGRVFGYIAYVLLFLSVVAGAGIYHLKKYISGRKIRILHSDLANLSFTMVIIHAIVLTIPNSPWSTSYYFFELLPERIPYDIGTLGLFLGRSALVLMYISVFSGFYLAKLIKRYGKRVGISIHMLAYVALIFGFVHTIILGGWANAYPIIILLLTVSVLSVGFLKWDAQRMLNRNKRNYEKRKLAHQLASMQENTVSSTEQ